MKCQPRTLLGRLLQGDLAMRRLPLSRVFIVALPLLLLIGLPFGYYFLIVDHENSPFCHKLVMLGLISWTENHKTDVLPNVGGRSADSIAELIDQIGDQPWAETYHYVPGLQKGDPGDLVVMYMVQPTRYIFHGNPQTIFADKLWMIVSLDFGSYDSYLTKPIPREVPHGGECSERVTLDEFRARLRKTLDFLRDNNRPNWQTVVAEHEKFLDSIDSSKN